MHRTSSGRSGHGSGLQPISHIIKDTRPDLLVSKRKFRKAETIQLVRENREADRQNLGFSPRPFVLCGLPLKRPAPGCLLHERRNGQFVLQVTGHPSYGLPWGQDRLIPIFLATVAVRQQSPRITFQSAAEMLDAFGLQQGGSQYRRLVASFQRIFGATIFFGTDTQLARAAVVHQARFNFMSEARIWYSRNPDEKLLPGECQNMILLSDEFYREVLDHPIPTDLEAAKALCPARRLSTCLCGSRIAASQRAAENVRHSLERSVWSANLETQSMLDLASFAKSYRAGSISSGRCGRHARLL